MDAVWPIDEGVALWIEITFDLPCLGAIQSITVLTTLDQFLVKLGAFADNNLA